MMNKNVSAWFKNKELFKRELEKGHKWEMEVGQFFVELGYDVTLPEPPVAGKRGDFVDQKDLVVVGHIIEVKSRGQKFTSHADFPFETIFIDTKQGFDAKAEKPSLYICVSQKTGGMCALDVAKSFKHWQVERTFDQVRKIGLVAYSCHKDIWEDVEEAARRVIGSIED